MDIVSTMGKGRKFRAIFTAVQLQWAGGTPPPPKKLRSKIV